MTSSPLTVWRNPFTTFKVFATGIVAVSLLAGCDEDGQFSLPKPEASATAATSGGGSATRLVERDVEAPEIFSVSDEGLWDGRPSLGGVWVAHPDVSDPERVIIRNEDNGKFVIGALFRKERDLPGPVLQISSDAAAALDILAGAPAKLNVTALRREETEESVEPVETITLEDPIAIEEPTAIEEPVLIETTTESVAAPAEVSATSLDPIAAAGAAIDAAPPTPSALPTPPAPTKPPVDAAVDNAVAAAIEEGPIVADPAPQPTGPRSLFALTKPFIQVGTYTAEENAIAAAQQLSGIGILPTVKPSDLAGEATWRVVVGPTTSRSERRTVMSAIKAEGFADAFIVAE